MLRERRRACSEIGPGLRLLRVRSVIADECASDRRSLLAQSSATDLLPDRVMASARAQERVARLGSGRDEQARFESARVVGLDDQLAGSMHDGELGRRRVALGLCGREQGRSNPLDAAA